MGEKAWRVTLPKRPLTSEEWCQLASDLRPDGDIDRVAITIEHSDGSRVTYEHNELMRMRRERDDN